MNVIDDFFIMIPRHSEKNDIWHLLCYHFFDNYTPMKMKEPKTGGAKRVLVVEDDQDFRRYITDCLEAEGIS